MIDPRLVWLRTERVGTCLLYRKVKPDTGPAFSDCNPYPRMRIDGQTRYLHRWVWESMHGPIPDGLLICHRCDTPACLNPAHLFLGTVRDNNLDRVARQRGGIGTFREVQVA